MNRFRLSVFKADGTTASVRKKWLLPTLPFKLSVKRLTLRCLSILLFLWLWQLAVVFNVMWPLQFGNLPTPLAMITKWIGYLLGQDGGAYYKNIGISVFRVFFGIVLALITAVPLGIWIGLVRSATDTVYPILEIFRPVPLIAYLPVTMLLFPTTESSIIFITYIGAFFPILISVRDASMRVSPSLLHASRLLGSNRVQVLRHVYLPAMGPEIFTGLVVGVGASWMGVITAEIMSGKSGIGYFTWNSYNLMQYEDSLIGMFTIGALGFSTSAIVRGIERMLIKWKQS